MDLERYFELRTLLNTWKTRLAENLRRKAETSPYVLRRLRTLYDQEGCSDTFNDWLTLWCRQAAIQWILRVLFLRVLEDRGLLGVTRIRTSDGQRMWSQLTRNLGAASYLLWCSRDVAHLLPDLFGPTEFDFLLPDDETMQRFFDDVWRRPDPNREGWLRFDFRPDPAKADEGFQTRFIGDLYQELDSEIRERHALLQTPDFVSQFILRYTLLKRFEEKDFRTVTMIDITCGSGHFIVDGFWAFVNRYEQALGRSREQLSVQERTRIARRIIEEHLFGCDINPYATALARFRLILAACDYARPASLRDLRDLHINIVTIDSLIPYEKIVKQSAWGGTQTANILGHPDEIQRALPVLRRRYDVVVGNPPYILASDPIKRDLYREHYISAYSKFGLSAPFTERFLQMANEGGYVGLINSNAFARRQFGKALIEEILPKYDLQAVIDLSGAYIPGHGTPTLILFARHQQPTLDTVVVLSSIKGEPGIPSNPAQGKVWKSVEMGFAKGHDYMDEFIDLTTRPRNVLAQHPWQFGGSKNRLYQRIRANASKALDDFSDAIGFDVITGADEIYSLSVDYARRLNLQPKYVRPFVQGEVLRDWNKNVNLFVLFPYEEDLAPFDIDKNPNELKYLQPYQKRLENRMQFGKTALEAGLKWFEYRSFYKAKRNTSCFIVFPEIVSHGSYIVLDDKWVFAQTAPVIKLKTASYNSYILLAALLNTNVIAFGLKQLCFNKGSGNDPIRDRYVHAGNYVGSVFVPGGFENFTSGHRLRILAEEMFGLANQLPTVSMHKILEDINDAYNVWVRNLGGYTNPWEELKLPFTNTTELKAVYEQVISIRQEIRSRMIFLQEEMDWLSYEIYGLIDKAPLADDYLSEAEYKSAKLELGQRSFEVAGNVYKGDWSPSYQPKAVPDYLEPLIEARIALIKSNADIAMLEDPLYKRRWIPQNYEQEFQEAAAWWLAEKLEYALEQYGRPITLREWVRLLSLDTRVNAVLEVLTGSPAFDLECELNRVIQANAVANRPEHIFKISGLRKYLNWLQDGNGVIPEFESKDFNDSVAWRLRGKLNIPRERFIAYREFDHNWSGDPIPESGGPWFGWAGWAQIERSDALAYLIERANRTGWEVNFRQCGLRAALRDLLPSLYEIPASERGEFEAIAMACGIGLETRCYCQAFQQAYVKGLPCTPGLSAEVLGLKPIEVESEQPRRGKRKGPDKPAQLEFDL